MTATPTATPHAAVPAAAWQAGLLAVLVAAEATVVAYLVTCGGHPGALCAATILSTPPLLTCRPTSRRGYRSPIHRSTHQHKEPIMATITNPSDYPVFCQPLNTTIPAHSDLVGVDRAVAATISAAVLAVDLDDTTPGTSPTVVAHAS